MTEPAATDVGTLDLLRQRRPTLWINPDVGCADVGGAAMSRAIALAAGRIERAQPLLSRLFPEAATTRPTSSPLLAAGALAASLGIPSTFGSLFVKGDHALPVAGSIKARGGFHEVLVLAERLAREHGLVADDGDLLPLASDEARALFSRHSVVVGSTGNLGLSIGLIAAALGFHAVVHMSADAKEWKKKRLRDRGVVVVEHRGDYANAVARGRAEAASDPCAHFVDDEFSADLFAGYGAAAGELDAQLAFQGRRVDAEHPLFVYLPCGVGGAPGGITYALRDRYGPDVHCFFAEPVASPCMLVQLIAGVDRPRSVYDLGLDNRTDADGLAVGQASMLVAPLMQSRLSGIYTVTDDQMYALLRRAAEAQSLAVEPSACLAFAGPLLLQQSSAGRRYLDASGVAQRMRNATHVAWATGGSMMPHDEYARALEHARTLDMSLTFADA